VGTVVEGSDGGTFTLRPDGSYVFNPGSSFQHLGVDQSATTSIEYTVSDGEGGTRTATLTVTVTGTNDAPTLTPNVTLPDQSVEDVQEIAPVDIKGQLTDVGDGDTMTCSAAGLPPGRRIGADGFIRGTLDKSASQHTGGQYAVT